MKTERLLEPSPISLTPDELELISKMEQAKAESRRLEELVYQREFKDRKLKGKLLARGIGPIIGIAYGTILTILTLISTWVLTTIGGWFNLQITDLSMLVICAVAGFYSSLAFLSWASEWIDRNG